MPNGIADMMLGAVGTAFVPGTQRIAVRLMLGEMQEQTRLLEQALGGEPNLLGRDGEGAGQRGVVAGTRWMGD